MAGLGEVVKSKSKSPLNAMYFDEKYEIPNQVNLLPAADTPNIPSSSVNLPPPLPGVFIFDQPQQNTNKPLIDSNFQPLVTSSYDNDVQTLNKIGPPGPNKYSERDMSVPKTDSNEKYFQSPTLNVYDYQTSQQKKPNILPPLVSDVDSMLPPQGNVYQSLEPVSVNMYDTAAYCEPKVYQQLEPVSRNEYRLDMGKFVEQKFYQELNPLSVNDSKLPKNEKKTYQQVRSVPNLHFVGEQLGTKSSQQTIQKRSEIPPEYASSKLYQQLSKPPKKHQVRTNYPPERKSYHQLRPPGYIERPRHNLSKSRSQRINVSNPRPVTMHESSNTFQPPNQHQTYNRLPYQTLHNVNISNYKNDNNMTDPTINLSSMPNSSFPNKTHPAQRGFQEHKPKVYLELRNPVPIKETTVSSGSLLTNFATDLQHQEAAVSYDDCNMSRHTNVQYQNLQANDKQSNMRLPSPYEFKLPQTSMSNKHRMPKILGPHEYRNSQGNIRAEQVLHTATNPSLKPSETVSSSNVIPLYHVNEKMSAPSNRVTSFSFPVTSVCSVDPNASVIVKYHEDLNQLGNKNEINKLPSVISDVSPEIIPDLANRPVDKNHSNNEFAHVSSSSVFKNQTIENFNLSKTNDNRSSVTKEKSPLVTNEVDFYINSNSSDSKVSIESSYSKYEVTNTIDTNSPVNLERKSTVALENSDCSFSEVKSNVSSPDLDPKRVTSSTGNWYPCSPNTDSTQQGSKENEFLYETNAGTSAFSNMKEFSNLSTHLESANKVAVNKIQNENEESTPLSKTKTEEKQHSNEPPREDPTDLSISFNAVEKMTDSNICADENSLLSAEPSSEITKIQNWCPENNDKTTSSIEKASPENVPDESNESCSKISSFSQSSDAPSAEVLVKGESQFRTNEKFEPDSSDVSHETKILFEKDLAKPEAPSQIDEKENAVTVFQSSTTHKSLLSGPNVDGGSSETADKACSTNVSPTKTLESDVNSVQSGSQLISHNECKVSSCVSGSSEITSAECSKALSDNFTKTQTECGNHNIDTPVEMVTEVNDEKITRDCDKSGEGKKKVLPENVNNPLNFIPKKKRILINKPQLLSSKLKDSKSNLANLTDSKSTISLSEKNSDLSKPSLLDKTGTVESESLKNCKPITTVSKQNFQTLETLSCLSKAGNIESTKPYVQNDRTANDCKSSGETQLKVEEMEKLGYESLNVTQTKLFDNNNLVSETQSNVTIEEITPSKECIVSQPDTSVKILAESNLQDVQKEEKAQSDSNESKFSKNVSGNDSDPLETQTSLKEVKHPLSKKHKILQSEQHCDRSQTSSPIKIQTGKLQKKDSSKSEHCNTISSTYEREKESNDDETVEVQLNKSQSTEIVSEQSFETGSSMKKQTIDSSERIGESINKQIDPIDDSKLSLEDSIKASDLVDNKSISMKEPVKKKYSKRVNTKSNQDDIENEDGIKKSTSKVEIVTKIVSSNKSKSPSVETAQEKTPVKRKRKYRKTKKFEELPTVTKTEPLLKSK